MIVPNFPSPKDDYANAVVYILLFFTKLSFFIILIFFGIIKTKEKLIKFVIKSLPLGIV